MYHEHMSSTTEDYLKQIYRIAEDSGVEGSGGLVSLSKLASSMKVTPGTVTTMMKHLHGAGVVEYRPRSGVLLTRKGEQEALAIIRRHRLIELFLVKTIGLDWKYVHDEAEILEHSFSGRCLEKIDELLGHPSFDPHGDPIPAVDGVMPQQVGSALSLITPPRDLEIVRVQHHQKQFLEFLSESGLMPGTHIRLIACNKMAGTLTILRQDREFTLSLTVAGFISVR